jgi:hypothetical protein
MAKPDDVRTIVRALDGASEIDHAGRPAFRTVRRIFAVIRPDGLWLHLPPERKEFLFEADPGTFVRYMWGKTAELLVQLDKIDLKELKALLREACDAAAPRKRAVPAKRVSSRTNR